MYENHKALIMWTNDIHFYANYFLKINKYILTTVQTQELVCPFVKKYLSHLLVNYFQNIMCIHLKNVQEGKIATCDAC